MIPILEKSTSSYGNWIVRIGPAHFKYFWKKKDAVAYIERLSKSERKENPRRGSWPKGKTPPHLKKYLFK